MEWLLDVLQIQLATIVVFVLLGLGVDLYHYLKENGVDPFREVETNSVWNFSAA